MLRQGASDVVDHEVMESVGVTWLLMVRFFIVPLRVILLLEWGVPTSVLRVGVGSHCFEEHDL